VLVAQISADSHEMRSGTGGLSLEQWRDWRTKSQGLFGTTFREKNREIASFNGRSL